MVAALRRWAPIPAPVAGVDDAATAPAWIWVGYIGWLGTYVLYPVWAIWFGRTREVQ